ncbi:hypothetical protein M404DRAFT_28064 [Pisolithus tinctorius Marx 270]|uniref:Uncharacterized protein n=1 Tax=Pisolithus tinctorius Marx 270 TaxID=870435 RepID=A0A0C3JXH2_PISTI|nr:hypothetical protein M404DRAFT_28064 [Pisolithus tinctorius Marx 270]
MSFQRENTTPQPTPGHSHDYSQVADDTLVVLTDDSTDTECEKNVEKAHQRAEAEQREKDWTREEVAAGPSQKRAGTGSSRGEKKKKPRGKGKEKATETEEADDKWEIGGEDKPATPLEGPSGVGVHMQWAEWERERQLQAMERQAEAHETAVLALERMAEAAEWMAEAAEWTANEWALYRAWAEWVEMRRREDAQEARMAEFERRGGGWKRPQSEAEDKNEEADEGAEGDNEEEEDVGGEKEGGEEQEGGGEQEMEE